MFLAINFEETGPDLGILENRTEELFARLYAVPNMLAHGFSLQSVQPTELR